MTLFSHLFYAAIIAVLAATVVLMSMNYAALEKEAERYLDEGLRERQLNDDLAQQIMKLTADNAKLRSRPVIRKVSSQYHPSHN